MPHVAGAFAPFGPVTTQLRLTVPVKPLLGVTVIVPVTAVPFELTVRLPLLLTAKLAAPTLTATVVVIVIVPDVPVTVTV